MEGPADKILAMKEWLAKTGSPKSVIEKAVFSGEQSREAFTYSSFDIHR